MNALVYRDALPQSRRRPQHRVVTRVTAVWEEAGAWLALLPALFIAVGGSIATDSGPVAFRFTAMDEDSPIRKFARLGCSVFILLLLSQRARSIWAECRRAKLLLLLPLLSAVSVFWSQNPSHTLVDASTLALTTLFAIYLHLHYSGERLTSFLVFFGLAAMLLSVIAIAIPGMGIDAYQQDAWRGIFSQRNNCSMACVLFLVVALAWRPRGLGQKSARALLFALSLLFIVMSGSRTGWILTVFALLLTFGLRLALRLQARERVLFFMCIAAITLVLAIYVASHFTAVLATLDKDPTMTQRTVIWAQVVPSIFKHPLIGYGYSSFWSGLHGESLQTILTTGWMEGQAQDGYLDVLLELGLLGLVPLIFLFVRALVRAGVALERHVLDSSAQLALVVLLMVLLENIGETSLLLPLGVPWFFAVLAFLRIAQPAQTAETA